MRGMREASVENLVWRFLTRANDEQVRPDDGPIEDTSFSLTRSEYRICHRISDLDPLTRRLVANGRDGPTPLLTPNERQVAGIQSLAVVGVDEVDSRILVLHDHLPRLKYRRREVILDLEGVGVPHLPHDGRLNFAFRHRGFV